MSEPVNGALAIWRYAGSMAPYAVMVRIDEYGERLDNDTEERWFVADQAFTSGDERYHGFTWEELQEKFPGYAGPYIVHPWDIRKDEL